jgi:hypothetical protein
MTSPAICTLHLTRALAENVKKTCTHVALFQPEKLPICTNATEWHNPYAGIQLSGWLLESIPKVLDQANTCNVVANPEGDTQSTKCIQPRWSFGPGKGDPVQTQINKPAVHFDV